MLALGAALLMPGIASAQPSETPVLRLPAFDATRIAMLRALLTSGAFQRSLIDGQLPTQAHDETLRYTWDPEHAAACGAPISVSRPRARPRNSAVRPKTFNPGTSFLIPIRLGISLYHSDTADQVTLWLHQMVMIERTEADDRTLPTGQALVNQIWRVRGQVIAGIADTPAIKALNDSGRREFGIWLRLNYLALDNLRPSPGTLHEQAVRLLGRAREAAGAVRRRDRSYAWSG